MTAVGAAAEARAALGRAAALIGPGNDVGTTILENIDVIAGATGGVDRLRDLVIELALGGRLVPQEPTDEPAVRLLARARAALGLAAGASATAEPGNARLPVGWAWVTTRQLGEVSPRNAVRDDATAAFVPMPAVPTDYRRPVAPEARRWGDIKKGYTHFANGDIAVAKITPCFQNRKSCVMRDLPGGLGAGTTELLVLRPVSGCVDPNYLLLFYKSRRFVDGGVARMTGTAGQQRVPGEYFASAPIPLPPLAEQKRIVAKVDQLMALCDELEARQAREANVRQRLRRSAITALAGANEPSAVVAVWRRVAENIGALVRSSDDVLEIRGAIIDIAVRGRLGRDHDDHQPWPDLPLRDVLAEPLANGRSVPDGKGARVLRLSAFRQRNVDFTQDKAGAWSGADAAPHTVREGDLFFVRGNGAIRLVGRASVAGHPPGAVAFPDTAIRARPNPQIMSADWLWYLSESRVVRDQIESAARTTAGIFKVSQDDLYAVTLPAPPLRVQKEMVKLLDRLVAACDALEAKLLVAKDIRARLAEALVASATIGGAT